MLNRSTPVLVDDSLRESGSLLRKAFAHSNDAGFILALARGAILDVNPAACRMLGYTREELLARSPAAVHPDEIPKWQAFTRSVVAEGKGWTDELTCLTKGGTKLPTEISASAVTIGGETLVVGWVRDISARKRAEAALRESEERFRILVEHAADPFYLLEKDGRVVDVNRRACESTGFRREELLQMYVWELGEGTSREIFAQSVQDMAAGPLTVNRRLRRKDGTTFPVEVHVRLFGARGKEFVLSLARDVTERVRAEEERRRLEQRLARILESAMDAIITIDSEHRIALFNPAAEKVFRCRAAEVIGTPFERFLSPAFRTLLTEYIGAGEGVALSAAWVPEGFTALRADGKQFPVEATISRVEPPGESLWTVILRDVNDRRRAEIELRRLKLERVYLQEEIATEHNFGEIVGSAPAIRRVYHDIKQVAGTDSTVLIMGETGTGKELVARAVHRASRRQDRVLVKVNCAALSAGLIESELFGHEKGAFTGALARRIGRFELADDGSIFLDEIGDLPAELQAKLLRVLQEGEFERVGGTHTIKVDVRVIAATNRDLEKAVKEGRFRPDLYYRLKVFPLHVPPLRQRQEDVPLLVKYFARKYEEKVGKQLDTVPQEALDGLMSYAWPGNVRELANVIERAVILSRGRELELADWRTHLGPPADADRALTLDDVQQRHILEVLDRTGWRVSGPKGAARILGLKHTTLAARMKKLGIVREH